MEASKVLAAAHVPMDDKYCHDELAVLRNYDGEHCQSIVLLLMQLP